MRESAERKIQAYRRPIEMVKPFKYLGRVMMALGDNWPELVGNLRKGQKIWAWLTRLLGREGARPKVSGFFLKAVLKEVLIFGS